MAEIKETKGEVEQAIEYFERSADLYAGEEVKSTGNNCLLKVATLSAQIENYPRAIELFMQACASCTRPLTTPPSAAAPCHRFAPHHPGHAAPCPPPWLGQASLAMSEPKGIACPPCCVPPPAALATLNPAALRQVATASLDNNLLRFSVKVTCNGLHHPRLTAALRVGHAAPALAWALRGACSRRGGLAGEGRRGVACGVCAVKRWQPRPA